MKRAKLIWRGLGPIKANTALCAFTTPADSLALDFATKVFIRGRTSAAPNTTRTRRRSASSF